LLKTKVSTDRWFLICVKCVLSLLSLAWIVTLVANCLSFRQTFISAYFALSVGVLSIMYVVFVHIWRPKATKVKSLGELLGYTIVKKSDLRDALTKANHEHVEVEAIDEDSAYSKNPIFGMFKRKPKPKPLVKRKTINDWLNFLLGSQPAAFCLIVVLLMINAITTYAVGTRFLMIQDSSSKLQTILYFIGSLLFIIGSAIYVIILSISLIDESSLIIDKKLADTSAAEGSSSSTSSKTPSIKDVEQGTLDKKIDNTTNQPISDIIPAHNPVVEIVTTDTKNTTEVSTSLIPSENLDKEMKTIKSTEGVFNLHLVSDPPQPLEPPIVEEESSLVQPF
jgi:hypothetical protein